MKWFNRRRNVHTDFLGSREMDKTIYEYFEAPGAGHVELSKDCHCRCGGAVGFHIGVSWGQYGYTGGVIGRTEAIRMANFILKHCEGVTETEQEEYARYGKEGK